MCTLNYYSESFIKIQSNVFKKNTDRPKTPLPSMGVDNHSITQLFSFRDLVSHRIYYQYSSQQSEFSLHHRKSISVDKTASLLCDPLQKLKHHRKRIKPSLYVGTKLKLTASIKTVNQHLDQVQSNTRTILIENHISSGTMEIIYKVYWIKSDNKI